MGSARGPGGTVGYNYRLRCRCSQLAARSVCFPACAPTSRPMSVDTDVARRRCSRARSLLGSVVGQGNRLRCSPARYRTRWWRSSRGAPDDDVDDDDDDDDDNDDYDDDDDGSPRDPVRSRSRFPLRGDGCPSPMVRAVESVRLDAAADSVRGGAATRVSVKCKMVLWPATSD